MKSKIFLLLVTLSLVIGPALASQVSQIWKVPATAKKIRVQQFDINGTVILDTQLPVKPNQVFKVEVIQ